MSKYALIDVANLFYRARHVVRGDSYMKAGMALTIVFRSLRKLHREMKVDHMVFCIEGRSWRYAAFPQYKAKRRLDRAVATAAEQEEEEAFNQVMNDFTNYMAERTRCTVLQSDGVEGDDWIARWVQLHPKDEHVILSGDSDFVQLLAPNVQIYNGVDDRILTVDGVYDGTSGKPMVFHVKGDSGKIKIVGTVDECRAKHEKEQREKERKHKADEKAREKAHNAFLKEQAADPTNYKKPVPYQYVEFVPEPFEFEPEAEWWRKALFVKLIRGDVGDGIFSAYPGVRYNGSSKKVGICEAWEDRASKGYDWNNFMLQKWEKLIGSDEQGNALKKETLVLDEYKFNESLIDLTKQPDEIKDLMDTVIVQAVQKETVNQVGVHFLRFCDRHDLPSLAREANDHAAYLNRGYQND